MESARAETKEEKKEEQRRRWWPRRQRSRWAAAIGVAGVVGLLVLLSHLLDAPLRALLEKNINHRLKGYQVTLGGAHLELIGLGLTLKELTVRQQANPEPPVAAIPRLRASVEWRELLTFHLVADAFFDRPHVHLDLPQLKEESKDKVSLKDRGWQQALESIYPLKFNRVRVVDGDVVYIDEDPKYPYVISRLQLTASNIRNNHSRERTYPSPISASALLFDTGKVSLEGHADFLAVPFPGVHANYRAVDLPLDRLRPIVSRGNLELKGGTLTSRGEIEYAPKVKLARVVDATIRGLHLDYIHTAASTEKEKAAAEKVASAARRASREPGLTLRLDTFHLVDSELGYVHRAQPPYRLFLDRADVTVTNLSNHEAQEGPALAHVSGRFQGNGSVKADVRFRPSAETPDFALEGAIVDASLPSLNELLRAYGKLDVAAGRFSVYSQVKVEKGKITGYVKPLFADIQVYDPKQDKDKTFGKKVYERVAGGVAKLLENHKRDEVATKVDLSGSVEGPQTSTLVVIGRLLENAFIKAILPGFDHPGKGKGAKK